MAELIHKDLNKMQLQSFPPTSTSSLAELDFLFVRNCSNFYVLKQETAITTLQLISLTSHMDLVKVKLDASAFHSDPASPTTSLAEKKKKKEYQVRKKTSRNLLQTLTTEDVLQAPVPLASLERVQSRPKFLLGDCFLFFLLIS